VTPPIIYSDLVALVVCRICRCHLSHAVARLAMRKTTLRGDLCQGGAPLVNHRLHQCCRAQVPTSIAPAAVTHPMMNSRLHRRRREDAP
jgi:hypothetical protein